jgi:predicted GIY-YIG superfamily endonuclease
MTPLGNRLKRLIYTYEFPDNTVYVGLTFDLNERDRQHRKKENSQVYKHIKETGLEPVFKQITDDFVSALDAKVMEQQTIEKYANEGWKILNLAKAGGLGSSVLDDWTKEMVLEVAKKYQTRTEFCNRERRACMLAKRNGWYEDATNHMISFTEDWDFDKIHKEALKYKNRSQFKKNSPKAYRAALFRGIIDDVTSHMGDPKEFGPHNIVWSSKSKAEEDISNYKTLHDLRTQNPGLYQAIHRNGWQDLLDSLESEIISWTPDKIFDEARKYNKVIEFRNGSPKAYGAAKRLNLIPDIRIMYGQK